MKLKTPTLIEKPLLITIQHLHIGEHGRKMEEKKPSEVMSVQAAAKVTQMRGNAVSVHVKSTASGMIVLLFPKVVFLFWGEKGD